MMTGLVVHTGPGCKNPLNNQGFFVAGPVRTVG